MDYKKVRYKYSISYILKRLKIQRENKKCVKLINTRGKMYDDRN